MRIFILNSNSSKEGHCDINLCENLKQVVKIVLNRLDIQEFKRRSSEIMTKGIIETEIGNIEVDFYDDETPNTVKNFVSLAEKGFYDGVIFHRVVPDFVIQGGDPTGTGSGGPGYMISCECRTAAKQKHVLGALSMAHAGVDTGGSQFFIVLNPSNCSHLDRKHTVFGVVTKGMDVVNKVREGTKMKSVRILDMSNKIASWELKKL